MKFKQILECYPDCGGRISNYDPEELIKVLELVGNHNGTIDSDFDLDQLESGISVEMEHVRPDIQKNSPILARSIAKAIAKDHLSERSDYYLRLAKYVENKGK